MATRSPEGQHESPAADNEDLEEAPSAKAELRILMLPADDSPTPETAGDPPGPLVALLRRAGLDVQAGMTVPSANASEMLATIRMWLAVTWALTVLVTIAITVPAGVPIAAVIVIVAIELAGFAIGALSPRRRRAK